MLCYRDMTFCRFYVDCAASWECGRKLTPEVKQSAEDFGLPIMEFSAKPVCFKEIAKVAPVVVAEIKRLNYQISVLKKKIKELEDER